MQEHYDPAAVEAAAQRFWSDTRAFEVVEDRSRQKFFCLSMLPYPSGALHMGHVRNYTIGDVVSRYQRMLGRNVLQPMGWDAFGLPAENAAIKNKTAPAKWTYTNIEHMREQLKSLGYAIDWSREFATCKPDYYVHEQRMFVRLFEKGLVYRRNSVVNWDPVDQTVLANEQVIDGRGWRSGAVVEKREIPQWFLKITAYAQELLDELDRLDGWPDSVKTMQRNWIGRSEGLEIVFPVEALADPIRVFTTRPDTLMGATYLAIAAEHPVARWAASGNADVRAFVDSCRAGGVSEAELETQEKRGIATGLYALHPVTGEKLPIWIANFVLMGYGTGAVMSVPGHDERDFAFAHKYGLPIRQVIAVDEEIYDAARWQDWYADKAHPGMRTVNSGAIDGLDYRGAFDRIADLLGDNGERRVNFRLRDWGVSRQRYWGCPIPMIHCAHCGAVPVPEDQLPVLLPEDVEFSGVASPIKSDLEWRKTPCPTCGGPAERETDTFDTFMESSWYYARYTSPGAVDIVDERADYWLPVDQYIGGIEHAILHLLYFRFYHKLLRDTGFVTTAEPATNLLCQGMVIAETFHRDNDDGSKEWINPADVDIQRDERGRVTGARLSADGQPVAIGGVEKMSKSKNNGVDPQSMVGKFGADTVRMFSMFAAPPEQSLEWSEAGVEGCYRFLKRVWNYGHRLQAQLSASSTSLTIDAERTTRLDASLKQARREIHEHLAQAAGDYQRLQFNTVVSAAMKILKVLDGDLFGNGKSTVAESSAESPGRHDGERLAIQAEGFGILVKLLNPVAPHIAHALWQEALGNGEMQIDDLPFPVADPQALLRDAVTLAVQVNGKLRTTLQMPVDASRQSIEQAALADATVQQFVAGATPKKIIVVPGKIVNIVV
jgi:leucyl-tRNA synthetase